jgi:hypothetical protein
MVKVTRHEFEGGRDIYWTEFWRDEDQIQTDMTPLCDARLDRQIDRERAGAEQSRTFSGATK